MVNESYNEKSLPRIIGSLEDLQCVCKYENDEKCAKDKPPSNTVNPTRDIRANKRRMRIVQAEEAKKKACIENDTMTDMQTLHATFPKLSKSWELFEFASFLKIRRNLMTSDKMHSAMQEIITHENKCNKTY